jgi:hypothetical protein
MPLRDDRRRDRPPLPVLLIQPSDEDEPRLRVLVRARRDRVRDPPDDEADNVAAPDEPTRRERREAPPVELEPPLVFLRDRVVVELPVDRFAFLAMAHLVLLT